MISNPAPLDDMALQFFVDGRLDAEAAEEIERILAQDPDLAAKVLAYREQRAMLKARLQARYDDPIPSRLDVAAIAAAVAAPPRRINWIQLGPAMAASLVLGIGVGLWGGALRWQGEPAGIAAASQAPMTPALIAHRIFAADVRHPVEVTADEEAHLVQWLSRRLGRPISAPDLRARGYTLIGGRLLPAASGPAAQFMYEDQQGLRLTVYVQSSPAQEETSFRVSSLDGVTALYWFDQGWGYAVAAEADRAILLPAARDVYNQISA